ncbi:MAG: SurA N-terminal domain-containing protein [Pseudomonadota bacterium]
MVRTLIFSAVSIIACMIATPTVQAQTGQQIEGIVAVVNDDPISFTDVRQRAQMLLLSLGGQEPTPEQIQQLTSQALDQLIDEKLQLQEAAEYEVEVSDEDIQRQLESLAQQSGLTREGLVQTMLQSGINPVSLEEQTRADIAWRRIMGGLYGSRIRISANQIDERLARLRASSQKEQFQLAEIFLFAPTEEDQAAAVEAAISIRAQINAGAPFELAAQRFSSAPTAATGGDMGWVTLEDLDETRAVAVAQFERPGLSEPVVVDDGVYLLQVRNKRDPAEQISRVDLTRIIVEDGSKAALSAAVGEMQTCQGIDEIVGDDPNLRATTLEDLNVNELGEEGRAMVMNTAIGSHTDVFAQSGTLAVMFVCDRRDGMDDLPRREQIEDQLYSQQLSLVSERSLRNLRREATIIRR